MITVSDCPGVLSRAASDPTPTRERSTALENLERCRSVLSLLDSRVDRLSKSVRSQSCSPSRGLNSRSSSTPGMARRCHGCHGPLDGSHKGIPYGADLVSGCPLDHKKSCEGGIRAGRDKNGGLWRSCPVGYMHLQNVDDEDGFDTDDEFVDDTSLEASNHGLNTMTQQMGGLAMDTNFSLPRLEVRSTVGGCSAPTATMVTNTQTAAGLTGQINSVSSHASVTLSSSGRGSATSVMAGDNVSSEVAAARARLAAMQKKKQDLEILADLRRQEELMQAETQNLQQELGQQLGQQLQVSHTGPQQSFGGTRSRVADGAARLRALNRTVTTEFDSGFYGGPNMPQIRKTPGLAPVVERGIDKIRSDAPSLARRPSAPVSIQPSMSRLGRDATSRSYQGVTSFPSDPFDPLFPTKSHQQGRGHSFVNDLLDFTADGGQQPFQLGRNHREQSMAHPRQQDMQQCPDLMTDDPLTEPSDDEENSGECLRLVYRRDKFGRKYRTWEPFQATPEPEPAYAWFFDPKTGREYRKEVPSSRQQPQQGFPGEQLSRSNCSNTVGLPARGTQFATRRNEASIERVATFVPLQSGDKEGKTEKNPSIVEWGRRCPVLWAEKINHDSMNIVVWVWAYLAEILSAISGGTSELDQGELQARLQHLLCVLQVCASHSEKNDFDHQGWKVARLYAKKVQAQLDRSLVVWSDFSTFRGNPHPSELIAAKEELVPKVIKQKKVDDGYGQGKSKILCTTWNSSTVERKCDWMVKNPGKGKCNRRHDCSYCLEKGHGTFMHQKQFCSRRIAAGDS